MKERSLFGRRELLRAAGLTLLVPTFLQDAFAGPPPGSSRLVIMMQANGTHQSSYWPDPLTQSSPILAPLLENPALASKTLLVRGVENRTLGPGNEHDRGFSGLWTGVRTVGRLDDAFGGGPSIDQVLKASLAPKVLFPTLNVGVLAADVAPKNGHRRSFSYLGPMQQVATQVDPYRVYAALFRALPSTGNSSPGGDAQVVAKQQLLLQRSVLDATARDLSALSARLGPKQRLKLDAHATALREYENRLAASLSTESLCARPAAPEPGLDPHLEEHVPQLFELMVDLVAIALTCNLTRVVTFPIGFSGHQWFYRWLGVNKDNHSDVAHLDPEDGSNPEVSQMVTRIGTWTATYVARLASRLEDTAEETGTALDTSLLIWANENATGSHRLDNLPIALVGRAAGRLTKTGVLDSGPQPHHRLCTSVLHLMGVEAAGFGDEPTSGGLVGL